MTEGRRPGPAAIRRALAELLTLDDIAAVMGWSPASAAKYRQRPEPSGLPEPDATIGRTPVWFRVTIERWREQRPGRGAGGGRPVGYSPPRKGALPAGAGAVRCGVCGATASAAGDGSPIVLRHNVDDCRGTLDVGARMRHRGLGEVVVTADEEPNVPLDEVAVRVIGGGPLRPHTDRAVVKVHSLSPLDDADGWLADQPATDAPQPTPRRNGKATARREGAGE